MFIVPGIVGILLTITMTLITSTAVVRERERGTLEQLIVTPIGKTSLMLGKLVPFVLVGYVQMTVVLLLGTLLFTIPIRGSLPLLYGLALVFIVASLGVGLLISTIARNQMQAMQLSFFFMLPNILLSGYIFPRAAMPEPAQWIGALLPLTWFLEILRGVLLKGVGHRAICGRSWRSWGCLRWGCWGSRSGGSRKRWIAATATGGGGRRDGRGAGRNRSSRSTVPRAEASPPGPHAGPGSVCSRCSSSSRFLTPQSEACRILSVLSGNPFRAKMMNWGVPCPLCPPSHADSPPRRHPVLRDHPGVDLPRPPPFRRHGGCARPGLALVPPVRAQRRGARPPGRMTS